ncbi:unnamed protein product [Coregonus sp. 'balchen']|nr:unnamed protein product [Coregonus sp. 'balchen']
MAVCLTVMEGDLSPLKREHPYLTIPISSPPRYRVNMTTINTANINFKWDPKSLEIRTLAVERLLEPLVTQVTTLVNSSNKGPSNKKKGRSKKAHVLAASVETATLNFLDKGEKIAKESQFLKDELTAAVEDVRKQALQRFSSNPDSPSHYYPPLPRYNCSKSICSPLL